MANKSAILRLARVRLAETESALGGIPLDAFFVFGEYSHFSKPRGFGVTFIQHGEPCEVRLSDKLTRATLGRVDAIIRHEIGHVVDALCPADWLDAWAKHRGVPLPRTPEVRADKIAEAVWAEPLLYDSDTVQNTVTGTPKRPAHLGL